MVSGDQDPPSEDAFRAWGPGTEELQGEGLGERAQLRAEKWGQWGRQEPWSPTQV